MNISRIYLIALCLPLAACGGSSERNGDQQTATVYQSKQAIQCESSGLSPEESAQTLIKAGIDVIESHCAHTNGPDVLTVCGEGTTEIIVHVIPTQSVTDAEAAGFSDTSSISEGYTTHECSQEP